nr:glycosyltransferase [Pseudomonas sp. ENNP23]
MCSNVCSTPRQPLVCICIPCFNNERTIGFTLESILGQTYKEFIIKVFDNASTDATVSIVKEFIRRGVNIQLTERAVNIGGEGNFNECIKAAEGDYTAIFHADDVYDSDIVAIEVSFLQKNLSCSAVSTHARLIDGNGVELDKKFLPEELRLSAHKVLSREEFRRLVYKYGNFITCPSVLFRTASLKEEVVTFRNEHFASSSDLDVWLRLASRGGMGFIRRELMSYRVSAASFSYNRISRRVADADMFLVLNYHLNDPGISSSLRAELAHYRDFLLLRDRASTNINRLILEVSPYQSMPVWRSAHLALSSSFHFKAFLLSLAVKLFISIPVTRSLGATIKRWRYGR